MRRATPRGGINLRLGSYLNRLGDGRFYSIGPEPPALGWQPDDAPSLDRVDERVNGLSNGLFGMSIAVSECWRE
jgi:hypothetical protein